PNMNPSLNGSAWSGFYKKTLNERQNELKLAFPDLFNLPPPSTNNPSIYATPSSSICNSPLSPICRSPISLNYSKENESKEGINDEQLNYLIKKLEPLSVDQNPFPIKGLEEHIADKMLLHQKSSIIKFANQFCDSMVKRGGGVFDMSVRRIPRVNNRNPKHHPIGSEKFKEWLVVHLHIDVCDSMGANCASKVAEGVAPHLSELTGGRIGLRILSNLSVERMAKVID
ncbi:17379_t:CDS:2, partial [Racocetra fulgida]